ncbi:GerMN domain-containing protein [Candidatus Parcubacteria bacterium]|nr:GerMN domain-containing protein [Candidatus Parcubacteria bacterium]
MKKNEIIIIAVVTILGGVGLWLYKPTTHSAVKSHTEMPPTMQLKIFVANSKLDPQNLTCNHVFPLTRTVEKTNSVAKTALNELLKGVTDSEKTGGYLSVIEPDVTLKSISIKDGVVYADFDKTLERSSGGACKSTMIISEIKQTLLQFSTVKDVVISIDGNTEDILQP